MTESVGDWREYQRLVLSELERLGQAIEHLDRKIDTFRREDIAQLSIKVAMLEVRAGLWGALAGTIFAVVVAVAVQMFFKR